MSYLGIQAALPYFRLYIVATIVLVLDQITKLLVIWNLDTNTYLFPSPVQIIDDFFYLVHIHNTGAAWGQFANNTLWLAALAIVALVAIYFFRQQLELNRIPIQYAFGLLIGGIIGNCIDRLYHGYVIDFLDFHLLNYRWPAFNIADCGITVGVALYIYYSFKKAN